LSERQRASIIELDAMTSTCARTRFRHALNRVASTVALTFSTPESAYKSGRPLVKARLDRPGEDLAGEVVDDRVEVRLGAVEQPHDTYVDVPDFVCSCRTDQREHAS
jgi:hypothetical protein